MADITDAEAICFINEMRAIGEQVRALKAELDDRLGVWEDVIQPKLQTTLGHVNADMVDDGREAEGISRLSFIDVKDFIDDTLTAVQAALDADLARGSNLPRMDAVRKVCVRPLRAR